MKTDDAISVAVLGAGSMGRKVIGELVSLSEVRAVHVWDPSSEARERLNGLPKVHLCTREEEVFTSPEIRLVFIAAPNDQHGALAIRALASGKAVLCEKPIAATFQEAEKVVREAERLDGFLQIGFELRYSLLYTRVKEWIEAGLLGKVVNIQSSYICSEFHGKGSWRNHLQTGGSMFGEKLCHYVDLPRWWTGDEVEEVHTFCAPNVVPYFEVRDNYHTSYRFRNGAVGHLSFSMFLAESYEGDPLQNAVDLQKNDGHELRFLITGTAGAAETDVFQRKLRRWEFGDSPRCMTSKIVEQHTWEGDCDHRYFHNTTAQTADVVRRVLQGRRPATAARDALETMRVCEAADLSANERRPIRLST